jgi:hypothetical protein
MTPTIATKLRGHVAIGPTGVLDQSVALMSAPQTPAFARKGASMATDAPTRAAKRAPPESFHVNSPRWAAASLALYHARAQMCVPAPAVRPPHSADVQPTSRLRINLETRPFRNLDPLLLSRRLLSRLRPLVEFLSSLSSGSCASTAVNGYLPAAHLWLSRRRSLRRGRRPLDARLRSGGRLRLVCAPESSLRTRRRSFA